MVFDKDADFAIGDTDGVDAVPPDVVLAVVPFVIVAELVVRKLPSQPAVPEVVLEDAAEVSSLAVILAPAVVSLLVSEVVDGPVVVGALVPEIMEELTLEMVALPLVEVVSASEVAVETPPIVIVLCGPVAVPVLLVVGPLAVADEVVDVGE